MAKVYVATMSDDPGAAASGLKLLSVQQTTELGALKVVVLHDGKNLDDKAIKRFQAWCNGRGQTSFQDCKFHKFKLEAVDSYFVNLTGGKKKLSLDTMMRFIGKQSEFMTLDMHDGGKVKLFRFTSNLHERLSEKDLLDLRDIATLYLDENELTFEEYDGNRHLEWKVLANVLPASLKFAVVRDRLGDTRDNKHVFRSGLLSCAYGRPIFIYQHIDVHKETKYRKRIRRHVEYTRELFGSTGVPIFVISQGEFQSQGTRFINAQEVMRLFKADWIEEGASRRFILNLPEIEEPKSENGILTVPESQLKRLLVNVGHAAFPVFVGILCALTRRTDIGEVILLHSLETQEVAERVMSTLAVRPELSGKAIHLQYISAKIR